MSETIDSDKSVVRGIRKAPILVEVGECSLLQFGKDYRSSQRSKLFAANHLAADTSNSTLNCTGVPPGEGGRVAVCRRHAYGDRVFTNKVVADKVVKGVLLDEPLRKCVNKTAVNHEQDHNIVGPVSFSASA